MRPLCHECFTRTNAVLPGTESFLTFGRPTKAAEFAVLTISCKVRICDVSTKLNRLPCNPPENWDDNFRNFACKWFTMITVKSSWQQIAIKLMSNAYNVYTECTYTASESCKEISIQLWLSCHSLRDTCMLYYTACTYHVDYDNSVTAWNMGLLKRTKVLPASVIGTYESLGYSDQVQSINSVFVTVHQHYIVQPFLGHCCSHVVL